MDRICHVTCDLISLLQISNGRIYPDLYLEMDCWLCCKSMIYLIIYFQKFVTVTGKVTGLQYKMYQLHVS